MRKSINIDEYYLRQTEAVDELFSKITGFDTLQVVSSKRYHNTADVNNEMILRMISKNTDSLEHLQILGTDTTEAMLTVVFATCNCLISLQLYNCYKFTNESYVEFSNISNTLHTLSILHSSSIHTSSILLIMVNFRSLVRLNVTSCESVDLSAVRAHRDTHSTDLDLKLIRCVTNVSGFAK